MLAADGATTRERHWPFEDFRANLTDKVRNKAHFSQKKRSKHNKDKQIERLYFLPRKSSHIN